MVEIVKLPEPPEDTSIKDAHDQMLANAAEGEWEELVILGWRPDGAPSYSASPDMDTRDLIFLLTLLQHGIMYEFEAAEQE